MLGCRRDILKGGDCGKAGRWRWHSRHARRLVNPQHAPPPAREDPIRYTRHLKTLHHWSAVGNAYSDRIRPETS